MYSIWQIKAGDISTKLNRYGTYEKKKSSMSQKSLATIKSKKMMTLLKLTAPADHESLLPNNRRTL